MLGLACLAVLYLLNIGEVTWSNKPAKPRARHNIDISVIYLTLPTPLYHTVHS